MHVIVTDYTAKVGIICRSGSLKPLNIPIISEITEMFMFNCPFFFLILHSCILGSLNPKSQTLNPGDPSRCLRFGDSSVDVLQSIQQDWHPELLGCSYYGMEQWTPI